MTVEDRRYLECIERLVHETHELVVFRMMRNDNWRFYLYKQLSIHAQGVGLLLRLLAPRSHSSAASWWRPHQAHSPARTNFASILRHQALPIVVIAQLIEEATMWISLSATHHSTATPSSSPNQPSLSQSSISRLRKRRLRNLRQRTREIPRDHRP